MNKQTIFIGIAVFSASLLIKAVAHPLPASAFKTTSFSLSPQAQSYLVKATNTYRIRLGDTLSGIAHKYGITLEAILTVNPDLRDNPNLIMVGEEVNLPNSVQLPVKPNTTAQKPVKPNTTAQKPVKPNTTVQKPVKPNTTVQKPVKPNTTVQKPVKPITTVTVQKPIKPNTTVQTPVKPITTAQKPSRSRPQTFANLNLPNERRIGSNRLGAKRGTDEACTKKPNEQLKALLPDTNFGYTLLDYPVFFWYLPELTAQDIPIKFSIRPINRSNGEESFEPIIYQTTIQNKGAGVMSFALPPQAPPLKEGQEYEWEVKIECTETTWIWTRGRIQRLSTENPGLTAQLEKAPIEDYPAIYAKAGVWYDALSTLAALRQKQPSNTDLANDWTEILKMIGFSDIGKAPLLSSKDN